MPKRKSTQSVRSQLPVPVEMIERRIYLIRGHKVMFDRDLADLYEVPTNAFNQAVKRNLDRFPGDFMFQLNAEEARSMRSQFVTASRRNIRYRPYVFTEQGVAMLSSVLRSKRAVYVNIAIMRAFVRLREVLATHKDLAAKIDALEKKYDQHDATISQVFEAIRKLMAPERRRRRQIGFTAKEKK